MTIKDDGNSECVCPAQSHLSLLLTHECTCGNSSISSLSNNDPRKHWYREGTYFPGIGDRTISPFCHSRMTIPVMTNICRVLYSLHTEVSVKCRKMKGNLDI